MPPVVYTPEAQDDVDGVYREYEARIAGLGDRFLEALARTAGLIGNNPQLYGEVGPGIRAAPMRRFPFVVYYRVEPALVVVLAVRHGRDDQTIWQGRI